MGSNSSCYLLKKDGYDNVNDVEEGSTVTLNIVKNENSEAVDYIVTKVSFSFINGIDYEYIDVPVTVDHTNNQISFTMPDKDVSVSAEIISVFDGDKRGDANRYIQKWRTEIPVPNEFHLFYVFYSKEDAEKNGYFDTIELSSSSWGYELTIDKVTIGKPYEFSSKGVTIYNYYFNVPGSNSLGITFKDSNGKSPCLTFLHED